MTRLAAVVTTLPVVELACGHRASPITSPEKAVENVRRLARRADGWYAAYHCGLCRRARAVVRVSYGSERVGVG
jgi:hypothetical protein